MLDDQPRRGFFHTVLSALAAAFCAKLPALPAPATGLNYLDTSNPDHVNYEVRFNGRSTAVRPGCAGRLVQAVNVKEGWIEGFHYRPGVMVADESALDADGCPKMVRWYGQVELIRRELVAVPQSAGSSQVDVFSRA